jgi:Raf kinase inhibitor-like YbhB/YbcL family protein
MELTSPAFQPGQPIPSTFTNKGQGINPPLMISGIPETAESLAIVMHDPNAPSGDFNHWLLWNVSGKATVLPEGAIPTGAAQGVNDFNKVGYGPPAPPSGTHSYVFDVYALNSQLPIKTGATRAQLLAAMEGHILATAHLIGTVSA